MAAGDSLLLIHPYHNEPPYTGAGATFSSHNGHPCLLFDASADEAALFSAIMPRNYAGGGVVAYIHWAASSATTGDCVWAAQFERIGDGLQDLSIESFATAQTVTAAAPTTAELTKVSTISFTNGAQMDSVANGELFRLKVYRDADNVADTMTGFAELHFIELREVP